MVLLAPEPPPVVVPLDQDVVLQAVAVARRVQRVARPPPPLRGQERVRVHCLLVCGLTLFFLFLFLFAFRFFLLSSFGFGLEQIAVRWWTVEGIWDCMRQGRWVVSYVQVS